MALSTEERLSTLEGRFNTLVETLANQLGTMNERMTEIRGWLIALTALAGVQFATMVTLAVVLLTRR